MTRLKIYNPRPLHTHKAYNLFWDRLISRLSENFDVEEDRPLMNEFRWYMKFNKSLSDGTEQMYLHDCDFAIENLDNGEFCIISTADQLNHNIIHEQDNPYLKKVLFAQYEHKHFAQNVRPENMHKYSPWIHFQSEVIDLDVFYYKRKYSTDKLNNKLYFRGEKASRPILQHFLSSILTESDKILNYSYFDDAIQYKLALSVGGVGEICYRDIEYMALGIPFIRFEFRNQMNVPLIPNVHYISVPRPDDLPLDRVGEAKHVRMIERRYLEVINDDAFLQSIAKNARQYYETYLRYPNHIDYTIQLLGIQQWM